MAINGPAQVDMIPRHRSRAARRGDRSTWFSPASGPACRVLGCLRGLLPAAHLGQRLGVADMSATLRGTSSPNGPACNRQAGARPPGRSATRAASVADIGDAETLAKVRGWKQAAKAAKRDKQDRPLT